MVCTEDHHFTARLQKHQVANACTENSMNHENHKFLHRSFFLLQLRWDLFHIVTFKSTVVLLNVPPVRTRGTFSKTIVYFFETPIPGKTCCIQICNQAKQFFLHTRNLYKQSSLYTRETFQTNQLLHTRNLSNKAVFTHSKPFKQSSFQTQQTFKQSRF